MTGGHRPIGALLMERGAVEEEALRESLRAQSRARVRIGDVLAARGHAAPAEIARAAAWQAGRGYVDLDRDPPDPEAMRAADLDHYLATLALPLRQEGRRTVFAVADDSAMARALANMDCRRDGARFLLAEPAKIRAALARRFPRELAARAASRRPRGDSIRAGLARWQFAALAVMALTPLLLALAALGAAATVLLAALAAVMAANGLLWFAAAVLGAPADDTSAATPLRLPKFTLLVPMYREPETAPLLICALRALDYPPELVEVLLLLEEGDDDTAAALAALPRPPNFHILTAPPGEPRTKPRALNYALDFATGDLIGIYDAEDRPAPDQLRRIAEAFAAAGPEVACVQARLGYYNRRENLLTRFFEIEYAAWFDVMLPGLWRMGVPVPLGGTSLFIRRDVVRELGGWDSHNVTEDADLGVMLARAGWRTALSASLTEEEANSRPGPWIKQRSRWLKGYMATWITHMRRPGRLIREIGLGPAIGLNLVLLAPVLGYLALPALWLLAALRMVLDVPAWLGPAGDAALMALTVAGLFSAAAMAAAGALGMTRRRWRRVLPMILIAPLYWPLGACAAWLAAAELAASPFSWRKTTHGVGPVAAALKAEALAELSKS